MKFKNLCSIKATPLWRNNVGMGNSITHSFALEITLFGYISRNLQSWTIDYNSNSKKKNHPDIRDRYGKWETTEETIKILFLGAETYEHHHLNVILISSSE